MVVEALIALSVLAVVVAAFTTVTASKARTLEDARMRSAATRAADAEIARLRALDFEALPKEHNRETDLPGMPGGRLKVQVKKAEHGLREVRVRVTWPLRGGGEETIVCYTLIGPGEK